MKSDPSEASAPSVAALFFLPRYTRDRSTLEEGMGIAYATDQILNVFEPTAGSIEH